MSKHVHLKYRLLFAASYAHGYLGASSYTKDLTALFFIITAVVFFGFGLAGYWAEKAEELAETERARFRRDMR